MNGNLPITGKTGLWCSGQQVYGRTDIGEIFAAGEETRSSPCDLVARRARVSMGDSGCRASCAVTLVVASKFVMLGLRESSSRSE